MVPGHTMRNVFYYIHNALNAYNCLYTFSGSQLIEIQKRPWFERHTIYCVIYLVKALTHRLHLCPA
jgi:hypothetical protein